MDINLQTSIDGIGLTQSDFTKLIADYPTIKMEAFPDVKPLDPMDIDGLLDKVDVPTVGSITEKDIEGKGSFDVFAYSIANILKTQVDNGTIDRAVFGDILSKTLLGVLEQAIQFTLNKDQATVALKTALLENIKTKNELFASQVALAKAKAEYSVIVASLQNQAAEYAKSKFELSNIHTRYATGLEEWDTNRANTKDSLFDGSPAKGVVGKNKDFIDAQIKGFKDKSQYNVASLATDIYKISKTNDEGMPLPGKFTNGEIDRMMGSMQKSVGF